MEELLNKIAKRLLRRKNQEYYEEHNTKSLDYSDYHRDNPERFIKDWLEDVMEKFYDRKQEEKLKKLDRRPYESKCPR